MSAVLTQDDESVSNDGERMIVGNAWGYWAHLSIYRFALPFAQGAEVLDAGSGAGYGADYLVRNGASHVLALDASALAIEHSRKRYHGLPLTFDVADLNAPLPVSSEAFDVVFSSNVFEHVGNVDGLAAECARAMKPGGVVIVAVPPICSAADMASDLDNHFHVHHIPPTAWHSKLSRFFLDVRCHAHEGRGEFASKERERIEIALPPDKVTIRETDFEFPETTAAAMLENRENITAVFVCRGRRVPAGPETIEERAPASWREGEAVARLLAKVREANNSLPGRVAALEARIATLDAERQAAAARADALEARKITMAAQIAALDAERQAAAARADALEARNSAMAAQIAALDAERQAAAARADALERSTIWRMTAPLRAAITGLRGR